jgi:alkylhydroperoxidase/carboxymuconolactone decarboxylase family protein YurZ
MTEGISMAPGEAGQVRERLEAIRAARGGYVLPHHGAMAAALPELHAAYEAMYRALTLEDRHLGPHVKEVVWLAILVACAEPVGTHHLHRFMTTGGSEAEAATVIRLAAWAAGAPRYATLAEHWQAHLPGIDMEGEYRRGSLALIAGSSLDEATARLALIGVQTALDQGWGLAAEITAAYAAGVPEPQIAEAMSLAIWPRGVNPFVRATAVWLRVMREGRVTPSPAFRAWAEVPGQGAFVPPAGG